MALPPVYDRDAVAPLWQELAAVGVEPLSTPEQVDGVLDAGAGTALVIVNSVCGCAAGKARPGIAMALRNAKKPDVVATVFAGADVEATERARQYFTGHAPSSPSIGLLKDGKLLYMMERRDIETRDAQMIAEELTRAFDTHCG